MKEYKEQNGHMQVPTEYRTETGECLGAWCCGVRIKQREGKLSKERYERLDALGFPWDGVSLYWYEGITHAKQYYEAYGNLHVTGSYICSDGYKLGQWIKQQRRQYHTHAEAMTAEHVAALEELEMVWRVVRKKKTKPDKKPKRIQKKKEKQLPIPKSERNWHVLGTAKKGSESRK